jgi:hypothetical protein
MPGRFTEGLLLQRLHQHLLLTAEKKFWRCVESGETPRLFGVEPPRPRIEAVRIVDMSASNSSAEFAGVFRSTRFAFLEQRCVRACSRLQPDPRPWPNLEYPNIFSCHRFRSLL